MKSRDAFAPKMGLRAMLTCVILALSASAFTYANAPSCYTYNGQGYCQYTGRVYQAYINSGGQIILYFDTAMPETAPGSVGIPGVTVFGATTFLMSENPDFGKAMYATLLAAQARGANVTVQMWGTSGGYMKMDRVWIYEN